MQYKKEKELRLYNVQYPISQHLVILMGRQVARYFTGQTKLNSCYTQYTDSDAVMGPGESHNRPPPNARRVKLVVVKRFARARRRACRVLKFEFYNSKYIFF